MAGIYKRGANWWGRAQVAGVERRRSLKTGSEAVARKRLRIWLDELEDEDWGNKPRLSLNEVAHHFIVEHLPSLRPSAARRYGSSMAWLDQHFGRIRIDNIGRAELSGFETWRRSMGVRAPTIRRDLACLSSIFSFAIEQEWLELNPVGAFLKMRRRKGLKEGAARERYLSHDEERRLIAAATPLVASAISFAIGTGLRQAEQFGLMWDRVDMTRGELTIRAQDAKSKRSRTVVLLPQAVDVLQRMPRHIRSPYVFCHDDGKPFRHLNRGLAAAAKRAGIAKLQWHDLRRTHGCRLLQDYGAWTILMVRDQLGHSSVVTTERSYAFLEIDDRREATAAGAKTRAV